MALANCLKYYKCFPFIPKMKNFDFVKTFSALLLCLRAVSSISATSYIHETDITRIKNLLISYIPCKDLSTLYGVSSALQKLNLSPEVSLIFFCLKSPVKFY